MMARNFLGKQGGDTRLHQYQMMDLVKACAEGIAVVDRDGVILFANPAAETLLEKPLGGAVGFHLGTPTTDDKPYKIKIRKKNGIADVEMISTRTSWEGKQAFIIVLRDVTENLRLLQALMESEENFRSLFETMTQGVICYDESRAVIAANPATEQILGLSQEQIMGRAAKDPSWRRIQEDGSHFPEELHPSMVAFSSGEVVRGVVMGITSGPDSELKWITITAVPRFRSNDTHPYRVYSIFEDITAQKKAIDQLQLLAAIIESSGDAIISKTLSGVITSWNHGAVSMYGYLPEEAIGQNIKMLLPPESGEELQVLLKQIKEGQKIDPYETVRCTKDGRHIYVSLTLSPIRNARGKVIGASAIARDITESRTAKLELEKAKTGVENLNTMLYTIREINRLISREKQPDVLIREACNILVSSKAFYASWILLFNEEPGSYSWASAGFEERTVSRMVNSLEAGDLPPCCLRAQKMASGESLIELGETCSFCPFRDFRPEGLAFTTLLRHDSRQFGCLNVFVPRSFGNDPEIRHLIQGITDDISFALYGIGNEERRKRVEEELLKSQEMLSETGEMAKVGGWEVDLDTNRIVGTRTTKRLLNVPENNFTTVDQVIELFEADIRPQIHDVFHQAIERGIPFNLELPLTTYDGDRKIWARIMGKSEFHEGICARLYGTIQDITELKKVQDDRFEMEKQLIQTQKLESIGLLAGGVAHDFNNLLSVILGYGEELKSKLHQNDPLYESASEIVTAGRRSADLTRQLLAFSRKQTMRVEVLDINENLKNLEKMLRRLIGEDVELVTRLADDLRLVNADPGQIEQVIMNLVVNSRDAMPGGGRLIIETTNTCLDDSYAENHVGVKAGKYVLIALSDSGIGMDEDTRKRIFEPFFTTKVQGKGTGLGLSTVYGIIKQLGGNIWVYSEPGQGTTFKIYLPAIESGQVLQKVKRQERESKGRQEMILLIEDDQGLRKLCSAMLTKSNFRVTAAANGGEALLLVEENNLQPDMIISDVIMPEMSGRMVVERLRKHLPDIKVLFMSGYTDNAIIQHGVLDPGIPFLEKPFTKEQLIHMVRDILDGVYSTR
jgi:PAS domain S-box-containing protein